MPGCCVLNPEVNTILGNYEHYDPEPSLDSVLCSHAALYGFMKARTFEGALMSAVNLGGDADTVGACCGALAGAWWGVGAIPERWSGVLEGRVDLEKLAGLLWEKAGNVQ